MMKISIVFFINCLKLLKIQAYRQETHINKKYLLSILSIFYLSHLFGRFATLHI